MNPKKLESARYKHMIHLLKNTADLCNGLITILFFVSLGFYFFILSYVSSHGIDVKYKSFSVTLILKEFKKLIKYKKDNTKYIYYIFIYLNVFLAIVFIIGMTSRLLHIILAPNAFI